RTLEFTRQFDGALEQFQVVRTRDLDCAELFQMRCQPLCVEQREFSRPQMLDQREERDLRGVALAMKHRFAEERAANGDTVESAGKLALAPRFDRMRIADLMQMFIALDNFAIDPRFLPPGAGANHFV